MNKKSAITRHSLLFQHRVLVGVFSLDFSSHPKNIYTICCINLNDWFVFRWSCRTHWIDAVHLITRNSVILSLTLQYKVHFTFFFVFFFRCRPTLVSLLFSLFLFNKLINSFFFFFFSFLVFCFSWFVHFGNDFCPKSFLLFVHWPREIMIVAMKHTVWPAVIAVHWKMKSVYSFEFDSLFTDFLFFFCKNVLIPQTNCIFIDFQILHLKCWIFNLNRFFVWKAGNCHWK